MSMVAGDNRPVSPRVMPQVFTRTASAQEVADIRRGRANWFVVAILAVGMLLAAAVGFYFLNQAGSSASRQGEELQKALTELETERDEINADLAGFLDFKTIKDRWGLAQAARLRIDQGVQTRPMAATVTRNPRAYVRPRVNWNARRGEVEAALRTDRQELEAFWQAIKPPE